MIYSDIHNLLPIATTGKVLINVNKLNEIWVNNSTKDVVTKGGTPWPIATFVIYL